MSASRQMRVDQVMFVTIRLDHTFVNVHQDSLKALGHKIHWIQIVMVRTMTLCYRERLLFYYYLYSTIDSLDSLFMRFRVKGRRVRVRVREDLEIQHECPLEWSSAYPIVD